MEDNSFNRFFNALPEKDAKTLRLFDRGEYYTVHGDDAAYVAENVFGTKTVIKYYGTDNRPYVTLTKLIGESLIKDLLTTKQFRVELYENSSSNQWKLTKKASPGNLEDMEDLLYRNFADANSSGIVSPVIAAIKLSITAGNRTVGLAFVNASDRTLGMIEFQDNEIFSNLESLLIQLTVKECLVPSGNNTQNDEYAKIQHILDRADIVSTSFKPPKAIAFETKSFIADMEMLVNEQSRSQLQKYWDWPVASEAMSWLVTFMELMLDCNADFQVVANVETGTFMRLDCTTVKALYLQPTDNSTRKLSLLGLLDHCQTKHGSRLLYQWIHQPLIDLEQIQERHEIVSLLISSSELRKDLQNLHLKNIPDLAKVSKRFKRGKGSVKEILLFYDASQKLPGLFECLSEVESPLIKKMFVDVLCPTVEDLKKLNELVETTIDLEAVKNHQYRIKAEFDDRLVRIEREMREIQTEIKREAQRVADELNLEFEKKLKLERNAQHGHHLRVSRLDSNALRGRSFIELSTLKAGVLFTTDRLMTCSSNYEISTTEYDRIQSNLVKDIVDIVKTYCQVMEDVSLLLAHLDVLVSFAHVAATSTMPYVRPQLYPQGQGNLLLKEARHPCLELQQTLFIANDVQMERGQPGEFILITGPNMGGKSTFIRMIATISLMAQIGAFVPCSEAQMPIFDAIHARVGSGDSLYKGVSTFMAEMLDMANILKSASKNSLVIIDELGRGTSSTEGFGLAWAITEYLALEVKCFTLFATHFHELTLIAEKIQTVKNCHMSSVIDNRGLTLLYKVLDGPSNQSFGINVAELLEFPEDFIRIAKLKLRQLEGKSGYLDEFKYSSEFVDAAFDQLKTLKSAEELKKFVQELKPF